MSTNSTESLEIPDWYNGIIKDKKALEEALEFEKIMLTNHEREYKLSQTERDKAVGYIEMINTKARIASLEDKLDNWEDL